MRHRCTTLPLYHFTIWKCIALPLYTVKAYLASGVKHWRTVYCFSKPLIVPYSHEKRLYGSLYHNQHKPFKIAFKRVTSLCPFYRTQNLFYAMPVASCRCAFYAVYSPHLQAIFHSLIYSYTSGLNTLKKENTRFLWNS